MTPPVSPRRLRPLAAVILATLVAREPVGAAPASARYDTAAIAREFDAQCASGAFSGVVLVRVRGQTAFDRQCGLADIVNGIANTRDTRFKIYSTSKFVTALTVMRLMEQGRLTLDAPLARYVRDVPPEWRMVTLRQLLQHSSGIPDLTGRLVEMFKVDQPQAMRAVLAALTPDDRALKSPPGAVFHYNNFGFELLAAAAAQAGGTPFAALVAKELFGPAGMTTASIEAPNLMMGHPASVSEPGLAIGYNGAPGRLEQATNYAFVQLGAGAIRASVADFVALDAALGRGAILSHASLAEMTRTLLPDERPGTGRRYGLGVIVRDQDGVVMQGHTGGTNGYISDFERFPDDGAMMIALTNRGFAKTRWLADGVAAMLNAARRR